MRKIVSPMLITIFILPSILQSGSCINCISELFNNRNGNQEINKTQLASSSNWSNSNNNTENNDYLVPLDDNYIEDINKTDNIYNQDIISTTKNQKKIQFYNSLNGEIEYYTQYATEGQEEEEIVLIDEREENKTPILYACDDYKANLLVCDSDTKICECV